MSPTQSPSEEITATVMSWPGVESRCGRRGEFAFKLAGRELGHLHGDHAAHFFFPEAVWEELHRGGRIGHHPVFPDRRGAAARRIAGQADVDDVIAMMRLNFERIAARQAPRAA